MLFLVVIMPGRVHFLVLVLPGLVNCNTNREPGPESEHGVGHFRLRAMYAYLTQCIHELVLESQLPHKIVDLIF